MTKKFFITIAFSILALNLALAQYNLQFKSVKTWDFGGQCTGSWQANVFSQSITVDPGTVLKIESASSTVLYGNANGWYQNLSAISLDNNMLYGYFYSQSSYTMERYQATFPIWLHAGTYTLRVYENSTNNYSSTFWLKGFVSAIEFNLVTP
ncbi:MAG: hypothetical protein WCM76_13365 [Bacteroidota bacterium]